MLIPANADDRQRQMSGRGDFLEQSMYSTMYSTQHSFHQEMYSDLYLVPRHDVAVQSLATGVQGHGQEACIRVLHEISPPQVV